MMFRTRARLAPWLGLILLIIPGCSNGAAKQILADAQDAVQMSLEAWKRGDKPANLQASTQPIEFFDDDWSHATKLVEFTVHKTYLESDGTARCAVELVVQTDQPTPKRIQVTYQVVSKEQRLVIARDPFLSNPL